MDRGLGTCDYNRISNINMIGAPEEEKEGEAEKVLKGQKILQIWQQTKLRIKKQNES